MPVCPPSQPPSPPTLDTPTSLPPTHRLWQSSQATAGAGALRSAAYSQPVGVASSSRWPSPPSSAALHSARSSLGAALGSLGSSSNTPVAGVGGRGSGVVQPWWVSDFLLVFLYSSLLLLVV